jgi:hypothetical protein
MFRESPDYATKSARRLFAPLGRKRLNRGNILQKLLRQALVLFEVLRTIVRTQTIPWTSFQTKIFRGRSIALLVAATISGVSAFGLPKMSSLVGGIFMPLSRLPHYGQPAQSTVSFTEWLLAFIDDSFICCCLGLLLHIFGLDIR